MHKSPIDHESQWKLWKIDERNFLILIFSYYLMTAFSDSFVNLKGRNCIF